MGILEDIQITLSRMEGKLNRSLGMALGDARRDNAMASTTSTVKAEIERLREEVTEANDVSASIIALVGGLAQQVRDNASDPHALARLADEIDGNNKKLASAVVANTPFTPSGQ